MHAFKAICCLNACILNISFIVCFRINEIKKLFKILWWWVVWSELEKNFQIDNVAIFSILLAYGQNADREVLLHTWKNPDKRHKFGISPRRRFENANLLAEDFPLFPCVFFY